MLVSEFTKNLEEVTVASQRRKVVKTRTHKAISMLELLVSMAIIAMVAAIMMPALRKAQRKALATRCMDNQRQIVIALSTFASDNSGEYPESVATIGQMDEHWNWQEPTMMTAYQPCRPEWHRSMSAYLYNSISDVSVLSCPSEPRRYKFLQQAWDSGDDWDNPDTPSPQDPVMGTYCFYWKYTGFLEGKTKPFKGPHSISTEQGQSKLLVSDYFGFGHWRNKLIYGSYKAYGSCERIKAASITPGTAVSSPFWSLPADNANINLSSLDVELHAAYTDGHVECFSPSQTIIMKVSQTPDGSLPYPDELGPGKFYLPEKALPQNY